MVCAITVVMYLIVYVILIFLKIANLLKIGPKKLIGKPTVRECALPGKLSIVVFSGRFQNVEDVNKYVTFIFRRSDCDVSNILLVK